MPRVRKFGTPDAFRTRTRLWRGQSSRAHFSITERSAVKNSADTLDGGRTAAAISAAASIDNLAGELPVTDEDADVIDAELGD